MNKEILISTPDEWQPVGSFVNKGTMLVKKYTFNDSFVNATDTHRFQSISEEWIYAKDCKIGDKFISVNGSSVLLDISEGWHEPICDIEILHPNHRYYTNGICSHNTGGLAIRFQLSARYLLRMTSTLKEQSEDDVTGEIEELRVANVFRIESIKNKCFPPFKREKYVIRFGVGTDDTSIIKDYLTAVGVISTTGSFISYKSDNPDLCFRLNGKTAFNKRFSDPNILEDAKKQFLHYKSSGKEIQIQSNADIWGEGVNTIDDDDGVVEELQV